MEVAGESESEAGWVTEEGEEEDEMDLSVSLRESVAFNDTSMSSIWPSDEY